MRSAAFSFTNWLVLFTRTLRGESSAAYVVNPHNGLSLDLLPATLPFFQTTDHRQDWLGEKSYWFCA